MKRRTRLLLLMPLLLASCTNVNGYLPWVPKSVGVSGSKAVLAAVDATITKATPSDPEYREDPWSFVLSVRNKTPRPLSVEYKIVFSDRKGEPTDVQYGNVDFPAEWTELRKGVVPFAESTQARITLYLPEQQPEEPTGPPWPVASVTPSYYATYSATPAPVLMPDPVPTPASNSATVQ